MNWILSSLRIKEYDQIYQKEGRVFKRLKRSQKIAIIIGVTLFTLVFESPQSIIF